jgi:DNA-binding transcriptional regulator PaaX
MRPDLPAVDATDAALLEEVLRLAVERGWLSAERAGRRDAYFLTQQGGRVLAYARRIANAPREAPGRVAGWAFEVRA